MFRQRTTENIVINVGLGWFSRILGVITKVVLARLLFPSDFAIFAIATGLIGFVGTFGAFGLDYAIIQKGQAATDEDYNVGMTLRLAIAVALFAVSVFVAGPWASLFPKFSGLAVTSTTQIVALIYLVTPWSFVPTTRLTQELRYRTLAIPNLAGQIANAVISIGLAVAGFSVWSLVYALLLSQVISTVGYVAVRGGRFRLALRGAVARPLVAYSRHLIVASLLAFLITNIDNFAVGRLLGPDALGYYAVAYGFGYLPVSLISTPAGGALFPSLTRIQTRVEALRDAYLESFSYAAVLILPAGVGLSVMASEIVHILLGPTWVAATVPLVVLGFYGIGRALVDFSSSLFAANGTPRIIARQNFFILILSLIPLWPLTVYYSISGTALSMTVPVLIVAVVSLAQSAKTVGARFHDFAVRLKGPIAATTGMGAFLVALRLGLYAVLPSRLAIPILSSNASVVTIVLLLGVPLGMVMYFLLLRLIDRDAYEGLMRHLRMVLRHGTRAQAR
ncbi:MAG TPA: oligosaccharide flippase family protein [Thermoplasmata archaeon]|nr:oligosaccharide flippase family protein [Thermoplasmata archaeon]